MRAGPVILLAIASCAAPAGKSAGSTLEQRRAILAAQSKTEYLASPSKEELLLIHASLAGATELMKPGDPAPGPLVALGQAQALLWGYERLGLQPPTPEEAERVLAALDKAMPDSSLTPLYRLRGLELSSTGDRAMWRKYLELLHSAVSRKRWESPVTDYLARWMDWMTAHEPDPKIVAAFDPWLAERHVLPFVRLSRMIEAMAYCPAPPGPLIDEVARLAQEVCSLRQENTRDIRVFIVSTAALKTIIESRFLMCWRRGDFGQAEKLVLAYDLQLELNEKLYAQGRTPLPQIAVQMFPSHATSKRIIAALMSGAGRGDAAEAGKKVEREPPLAAQTDLAQLREDLANPQTILQRIRTIRLQNPPKRNGLRAVFRERAILAGGPIPPDRAGTLIEIAFGCEAEPDPDVEGDGPLRWLLKEALMKAGRGTRPGIQGLLQRPRAQVIDIAMTLDHWGESTAGIRLNDALEDVKKFGLPSSMKGYCHWLMNRARENPREAAGMLPDYDAGRFDSGHVMIGEALRDATGQDFGFDLDAWRDWLRSGSR